MSLLWLMMQLNTQNLSNGIRRCICLLLPLVIFVACDSTNTKVANSNLPTVIQDVDKRAIVPLPKHTSSISDSVIIGSRLFHDPQLSSNRQVSCSSCHSITAGGVDNMPLSVGAEGRVGNINSPSVLNSGFNFRQFWDGRAKNLEEQVDGPIHNKAEMDSNWSLIISRLKEDPWYSEQFSNTYNDGITANNIKSAIANFERALSTPNSPFDRYLEGEKDALTQVQRYGYQRFKSLGCISCHQGINIGGNMYQRIGIVHNYFSDRGNITDVDYGLYNITKKEEDKFKFKVPSLRNIALTAPYFHDGQTPTLKVAIKKMAYYQLGEHLSVKDVQAIEAYLTTLTGEINPAIFSLQAHNND